MKKSIVSFFICIFVLALTSVASFAAEITLYAPSDVETEIMPSRDFYVVGKINRKGDSAATMPLNIKIELLNPSGKVVRTLESNVGKSGVSPAEYFLLNYEMGASLNDPKGAGVNLFTPPDIMFDGNDRFSVYSMENKIVVKEDYFAAAIYGGATKDFDLSYYDENQKPYSDITEGVYTLRITALDLGGEAVCSYEQDLTFKNTKRRLIASDNSYVSQYAKENNLTVNTSIVGKWTPSEFMKAPEGFSYSIEKRYLDNLAVEYGKADKISILLYNFNTGDTNLSDKITAAFNAPSEKTFLYFDIGEPTLTFSFNGATLTKEGNIVKNNKSKFIEILRSETVSEEDLYADFNSNDGFVLTKGNNTKFYGVYSPIIKKVSDDENVQIVNEVAYIKYVITDSEDNEITSKYTDPFIVKGEEGVPARYEFSFEISPDDDFTDFTSAYLTLSLCNSQKEEIYTNEPISLKINSDGAFIDGYDEGYWGKSFCDAINVLGSTAEGVALDPDEFITRGDFAAMINRLFGFSIASEESFEDLDEDSIYFSDCSTAQAVGYMTGDENGMVKADDLISREQAMIILARISKAELGEKTVVFKDSEKISFWAKDYVDIMASNGIVSGFEGYLNPTNSITVAEASALIIKTFKWMHQGEIKASDIVEEDNQENDLSNAGIAETDFISELNYDSVSKFLNANSETLTSLAYHFMRNYADGIYISRVGNGLEIRDYRLGSFITLPDDALNITTLLSEKFAEFSVKYNPKSENAVHFMLGRDDDGKQIGLTYTTLEEVKNKTLTHIEGNWYYYIQK